MLGLLSPEQAGPGLLASALCCVVQVVRDGPSPAPSGPLFGQRAGGTSLSLTTASPRTSLVLHPCLLRAQQPQLRLF